MTRRFVIGDTVRVTWINSGVTPSAISAAMYDGTETLVSSATMTSSGNGHYFARFTLPTSLGYYAIETSATVDTYPYKRRALVQAVRGDVD